MHDFTFKVSFFALMLLNGIANLATTIPAAPGYIGTWEAVTKGVLMAFNVPGGEALGYAIVLHVALWLPITLLGAFYMTREGVKWNDSLRSETDQPQPQE
jgi:glycosyltransferase 2 family protein